MIVFDTIVAECTAPYKSALSIVRISGPDCFKVASHVLKKDIGAFEPRKAYYVSIYKDSSKEQTLIDKGLVICFKGKESFTGEDSIEFYVHGSRIIVEELVEALVNFGARRAQGGEFSAKAYYNGKLDLTEAEAINQLINAKTDRAKDFALNTLDGKTSDTIKEFKNSLDMLSAEIEVDVDYPEYDEKGTDLINKAKEVVEPIIAKAKEFLDDSNKSKYLFSGIKIAIIGEPNVGKSTLLNKILGEDKAIVTDIPGTTRDVVEGEKTIDGIVYLFFDTAGIRKRAGEIEKIGIQKSFEALKNSDLVLLLSDKIEDVSNETTRLGLKELVESKPHIFVSTKRDITGQNNKADISISKDDKTLEPLYKLIESKLNISTHEDKGFSSQRDIDLLNQFVGILDSILDDIKNGMTIDVVEIKVIEAVNCLDQILGVASTMDDIYDTVFKNFCIGK
jgi:tRNA modification GTPase